MEQALDPRATLEALCRERGEDFAGLSRMLGRNAAYIQQFVRRGIPRKLDERDRTLLARYFGVDQRVLGGPPGPDLFADSPSDLWRVPRLAVAASAGPGALDGSEAAAAGIAFDPRYLRSIAAGDPAALSLIRVAGDSMAPTLADGDMIMVDLSDAADRLRDGIYVLRVDGALVVKRVSLAAADGSVAVLSDNPDMPAVPPFPRAALVPIGRVVWSGGRVS